MKTHSGRWRAFNLSWVVCLVTGMLLWSGHADSAATTTPLLIKISRLEKALDLIDTMGSPESGSAPTAAVRQMLQGLDWIDGRRAIVLLLDQSGESPYSAVLIPFRRANPNFQQAYNALRRDDYYMLSLPPGSGITLPQGMEVEMASASNQVDASTVSMSIALGRILAYNQERIDGMLQLLGQAPASQQNDGPGLSPDEIRQMATALLEAAKQIDTVTISLDLNPRQFKAVTETVPVRGSDLSTFFTGSGVTTRLDEYRPMHDITFRSRSYRVDSLLDILDGVAGPVYRKLGIDFAELVSIGRRFTGETAGGMTYGEGAAVMFESIAVLRDEVDAEHFIEREYLPWIEAYGRNIGKMMEKNTGMRSASVLSRTPDSSVEGHRVVGMRIKIPLSPTPFGDNRGTTRDSFMTYDTRTAVKGNLMLVAPDDGRLGEMIRLADTLKKKTARGPLMSFTVDLGRYLASLARLIPGHGIDPDAIPDFGDLTVTVFSGTGSLISSAAVDTDDIRLMIAYLRGMKRGSDHPAATPSPAAVAPNKAAAPVVKDAGYWSDRGGLAATYGAYASAIGHYEKALALGADEGRTHFNMGIAYGELGNYPEALANMEKAVRTDPENGAYYYGRGRLYLLSGDRQAAMGDFERAQALGNEDARQFLERQ